MIDLDASPFAEVAFDVPVPVRMPWPASIRTPGSFVDFSELEDSLRVYRHVSRRGPSLTRLDGTFGGVPGGGWDEVTDRTMRRADSTWLYVVLDDLRARRFYEYVFEVRRSLTARERAAFVDGVAAALDQLFREHTDSATLPESKRQAAQAAMLAAARESTDLTVAVRRGSMLDTSASSVRPLRDALAQLAAASDEVNRATTIRQLDPSDPSDLTGTLLAAVQSLDALDHDSTLIDAHGLLSELRIEVRESGITASAVIDSLHALSESGYRFATLETVRRRYLADGRYALRADGSTGATLGGMERVWRAGELEARIRNIERTSEILGRLAYLVDQVRYMAHYRGESEAASISDADLRTLHERLAGARDALRQVSSDAAYHAFHRRLLVRDSILTDIADRAFDAAVRAEIYATASSSASFETRSGWHVSADLGLAYLFDIEAVAPYFGVNVYLAPVN